MDQEQAALIKRIASVVGHELRNPLAVINNSAYLIKTKLGSDGKLDPKVEKHLSIVVSEVARADRMIADILAYSRVLEAKPVRLKLNAVVEAALSAFAFPEKVELKKDLSKDDPEALIDEALLKDALRRLLENAVQAVGEAGTVTVATSVSDSQVSIAVADSGPGIKPGFEPLLCEPFATTKPRGLGLGLATAARIAAAHKGRLGGKNAQGGGAVFAIDLPR
jgi:signal transduction histidine kinase